MKPRFPNFILFFGLVPAILLVSCSNPSSGSKITPTINITQARQTVESRLTQVAGTPTTPSPTTATSTSSTPRVTATLAPTHPISNSPTSIPPTDAQAASSLTPTQNTPPTADAACDRATHGYPSIDVTIDDDTEMSPGKTFTKIWRLSNQGSCTWSKDYAAVWFSGEKLGDTLSIPLGREVAPGESVDISVDMIAPNSAGTYQSNWKLRNAGGVLFGIGPNGDAPFWVRIIVVQTGTSSPTPTHTPIPTASETIEPTSDFTSTPTATPTDTPTLAPPIYVSGTANLLPGESINLSTGLVNASTDDDLFYQENQGYHLLTPMAGTMLGVYGNLQPTIEDCQSAGMSSAPIAVESLSVGAYLCYRTSQGLPGWLLLDSFNADDFTIRIDFLTWAAQ